MGSPNGTSTEFAKTVPTQFSAQHAPGLEHHPGDAARNQLAPRQRPVPFVGNLRLIYPWTYRLVMSNRRSLFVLGRMRCAERAAALVAGAPPSHSTTPVTSRLDIGT